MSTAPPHRAITVARLEAIEIALHWRWAPILVLGTILLGHSVLPVRFPTWAASTTWMTSLAVILAGEAALLLHELSHALVARRLGQRVERIIFHGFFAETIVSAGASNAGDDATIALVGPLVNLALAASAASVRGLTHPEAAGDVFLLALIVGNLAMAAMSLVPIGGSDGARALRALVRR